MYILGAGLAGCLAAIANPTAQVFETLKDPSKNHQAVLRFRNREVSALTGIDFEEIEVTKSIYYKNKHYSECNPMFGNLYSQKAIGKISKRSIWDLKPATRFIAPNDFHKQLLDRLSNQGRINFGSRVDHISQYEIKINGVKQQRDGKIISTLPIPVMQSKVDIECSRSIEFNKREISTVRGIELNSNVHQTIYFPELNFPAYRATLSNQELIIELVEGSQKIANLEGVFFIVCNAFGLDSNNIIFSQYHKQKFGKISTSDKSLCEKYISKLTDELNIYSLGRFATWRNILLDDVVNDLFVIKKLMAANEYNKKLIKTKVDLQKT